MGVLPTTVVIPTLARPSLRHLLGVLAGCGGPRPAAVVVVDDRPVGSVLETELGDVGVPELVVVSSGGGGPARARNLGWRTARTPWVSFLDDDVVPDPDWLERLADDLAAVGTGIAGSQGRVRVPLPGHRRATDWERSTAGLATASWITADMSYRRSALCAVGGFDERFPRAYREDADLALRILDTGGGLAPGSRWVTHPVRPTGFWVSVRQQAGNADDALMRRVHGPQWRTRAHAPRGRRRRHLTTTACGVVAVSAGLTGHRSAARLAAAAYAVGVAELARARIAPGPRDPAEIRRMLATSAVIPVAASWHSASGAWRHRRARPWTGPPELVLFDRDGTLVEDVPYNGDPDRVTPVEGAAAALQRLRAAGLRTGVVTNQSSIAARRVSAAQVAGVNARVDQLLGPFDAWEVCPHGPGDGCGCRKPAPGMVKRACDRLGVPVARCVVVGDIGSDVEAAQAAGAVGRLVPTARTRKSEIAAAPFVHPDLSGAVTAILACDT